MGVAHNAFHTDKTDFLFVRGIGVGRFLPGLQHGVKGGAAVLDQCHCIFKAEGRIERVGVCAPESVAGPGDIAQRPPGGEAWVWLGLPHVVPSAEAGEAHG